MRSKPVTVGLLVIGVPNVIAGLWAVLDPAGWYEDFPGWAPRLVSALPPYNEHLATDAGAGLLASGALALLALWWNRREVTVVAMTGYLLFALPHFLWHLTNPSDALSTAEDTVNSLSLLFAVVIAAAILWNAALGGRATTDVEKESVS